MSATAESVAYRPTFHRALPVLFIAPLFALSFAPRISTTPWLLVSFWSAAIFLTGWYAVVLGHAIANDRELDVEVQIVRTHWVQALVQGSIYLYWAQYWGFIVGQAPLILGQVLFAYGFAVLLAWSRGEKYGLGFGPIPIILSTNFFMCFRDDWFYFQFAMISVGMLGKEFIRWRKEGRSAHIFNPSAFGLFVFSILLIATGNTGITWAEGIAIELGRPEYIFLWIFVVGLVVQALFHVTLVTLAAAATLCALNLIYMQVTGVYWFIDAGIPVAVFLGLHLLVTDPATSPRTDLGRLLFGALYGACVFYAYALLGWAGVPRFYDKLLCVPVLNLSVRVLDRVAGESRLRRMAPFGRVGGLSATRRNSLHVGIWVLLFAWMYTTKFIGTHHPGMRASFWEQACSEGRRNACRNLLAIHNDDCWAGSASDCMTVGKLASRSAIPNVDPLMRVRAYARACDLAYPPGCLALQESLDDGSRKRLKSACLSGNAESCYVLGSVNLFGIRVPSNNGRALRYFRRSCELDMAAGCGVMADFYRFGVGSDRHLAQAMRGHEKACSRGYVPSCATLSAMLRDSQAGAIDVRRANALLHEACLLEFTPACNTHDAERTP